MTDRGMTHVEALRNLVALKRRRAMGDATPHRIIDISSNNPHPINWQAVKASGIDAVFIKATDGTGYTNPYYAGDAAAAKAAGLLVAAYHFAEFGNVAAEAAHFLAVAGADARILDSETNTNAAWQNAFLEALNLPGDEELDYGSASTLPRSGIRSFLWPASYGKNYGYGDCWQYTDSASVPGIGGQVDESEWIGSDDDWQAFWNLDPLTEEDMAYFALTPNGDHTLPPRSVASDDTQSQTFRVSFDAFLAAGAARPATTLRALQHKSDGSDGWEQCQVYTGTTEHPSLVAYNPDGVTVPVLKGIAIWVVKTAGHDEVTFNDEGAYPLDVVFPA